MAIAEGVDYSDGRPSGAALAARGFTFAVRYIDHPSQTGTKHVTRAEYDDLRANGIDVWLVFERREDDFKAGPAGGAAFARAARAGADAIGYPADRLIFFAVDMHLTPQQIPTAVAFIGGAVSVLGWHATGGYGFSEFIHALRTANTCRGLWQTGSRSALVPGVHIYQANDRPKVEIDGVTCDIDELLIPLEDDMPLTDADKATIRTLIDERMSGWVRTLATGNLNSVTGEHANPADFAQLRATVNALATKVDHVASAVDPNALAEAVARRLDALLHHS